MIEEVDKGRRRVEGFLHGIVIPDIFQTVLFCVFAECGVERFPIQATSMIVDFFI